MWITSEVFFIYLSEQNFRDLRERVTKYYIIVIATGCTILYNKIPVDFTGCRTNIITFVTLLIPSCYLLEWILIKPSFRIPSFYPFWRQSYNKGALQSTKKHAVRKKKRIYHNEVFSVPF